MRIRVKKLISIINEEVRAMKMAEQQDLTQQTQELQQAAVQQAQQALAALGLNPDKIQQVLEYIEEIRNK
jgi:Holliday junction resolvasome RuvABC DNA-binding subunit